MVCACNGKPTRVGELRGTRRRTEGETQRASVGLLQTRSLLDVEDPIAEGARSGEVAGLLKRVGGFEKRGDPWTCREVFGGKSKRPCDERGFSAVSKDLVGQERQRGLEPFEQEQRSFWVA
jgi:hypothetical protein